MPLKEILQQSKDALARAITEKKRNEEVMKGLGPAIVDSLKPVLDEISSNSKLSKDELLSAISGIQINVPKADVPQAQVEVKIPEIIVPTPQVTVNVPDIKMPVIPEIKIPKIVVPKPEVTVNVPEIKVPKLAWPEGEMDIKGWVQLQGVSLQHPLPVQLRDASGKPVSLDITNIMGGGSGGRGIVKVSGYDGSAWASLGIINGDGRLRVETNDNASSTQVQQVSGAIDSVNTVQLGGTAIDTNIGDVTAGTQRLYLARSPNATTTSVSIGADTSTSLVPTQLGRKSVAVVHESSFNLYVATGSASSSTAFPLKANQIYGLEDYTGPLNAIAEEGAGTIDVKYIEIV